MTHVNPILNQTDFRFREDSGNEATATFLAALNTNISIDVDTDFRYRVVVAETAGATNPETVNLLLEFSLNSGAFAAITGSTAVQFATFTGSSDADVTTQQLGSGTFVDGELDNTGTVSNLDLQSSETEMEYCLTIDSGQVVNDDTIDLRVVNSGVDLDTYGNTGRATAIEVTDTLLVIQEASHLHAADNLAMNTDLTIAEALHAHVADNLAMNTDLTVAEASHAHTADNLILDAYPEGWARKQKITIDNTKVGGSGSHTDFPMLITLDHLDSEIVDAGSNSALNGGGDIRFSSDSAGASRLAIDVISFVTNATPASRECEIRVKVSSISTSADTDIFIWYKKSGETQPAAGGLFGSEAAWSIVEAILAMEDATPDDRSGNHTFSLSGTLTNIDGPFGKANSFAGNDRLSNTDAILKDILETYDTTVSLISMVATFGAANDTAALSFDGTDDFIIYPQEDSTDAGAAEEGVRTFWRDVDGGKLVIDFVSAINTWTWTDFTTRASNDHELYQDGVSGATGSVTGTAGPFSGFFIGGFGATAQDYNGDIAQVIVWKTARNSGWTTTKFNNEFAPGAFATAGTPEDTTGITLVIQEASHAHTADNIDIEIDLAINEASHAHSADNLAMNTDLTVAEALHGHTADTLDIEIDLNIAEALHAHSADNLAMNIELAIDETNHAHTADNLIIDAGLTLIIDGANHAHAADNLDLEIDLAIDEANHGHTADNLAMGTDLTIQEALHAHAAENLDIGVDLFINETLHGHTADNITITQNHILAIQSNILLHTADSLNIIKEENIVQITGILKSASIGGTIEKASITGILKAPNIIGRIE